MERCDEREHAPIAVSSPESHVSASPEPEDDSDVGISLAQTSPDVPDSPSSAIIESSESPDCAVQPLASENA